MPENRDNLDVLKVKGVELSRNGLPEIVMSCHINVDKVGYMSGKSM